MLGKKTKKLIFKLLIVSIFFILISPYLLITYVKCKYNNLATSISKITNNGVRFHNEIKYDYLRSLLVSKITVNPKYLIEGESAIVKEWLFNNQDQLTIILQHNIQIDFSKFNLINISSTILTGLPKLIRDQKNFKISTSIDLLGNIRSNVNNVLIEYILKNKDNTIKTDQGHFYMLNDGDNLYFDLVFPKMTYQENATKTEMENVHFNVKVLGYNHRQQLQITLLTSIEKLYLIHQSKAVLKLLNFNAEQIISNKISTSISFLKLNILKNKYGPLATKLEFKNLSLLKFLETLKEFKLPINYQEFTEYKLSEVANVLLQYRPSFSTDLLLYIGKEKMHILTDWMVDPENADGLNLSDLLDSVNVNIFAKLPQDVTVEFLTNILEMQKNQAAMHLGHGKLRTFKEQQIERKNLNDLAVEKIQDLIRNNIIKEEGNSFIINLSIAEGTFYSRMNPFKIFSFN